jgi:hypothetical protein
MVGYVNKIFKISVINEPEASVSRRNDAKNDAVDQESRDKLELQSEEKSSASGVGFEQL